jgi:hypothetical protein
MISSVVHRLKFRFPKRAWYLKGRPVFSLVRLINLFYLRLKRKLRYDYSFYPPEKSNVPIDIFMPTLEKDAEILSLAIDYARRNIRHPIKNIYIVASPKSQILRELVKQKKCIFVDETSIIDLKKDEINYFHNGFNKNGWIYKMLLNLSADKICTQEHILILDSDTLFVAPVIFTYKGKVLFNLSDEYHQPYYDANRKILGLKHKPCRSFISHYMLFEKSVLAAMHKRVENKWNKPWYRAIVDNLDRSTAMAFADYESYGDFYLKFRPRKYQLNYWSNISYELRGVKDVFPLIKEAAEHNTYRSVSFHVFKKQTMAKHEQ